MLLFVHDGVYFLSFYVVLKFSVLNLFYQGKVRCNYTVRLKYILIRKCAGQILRLYTSIGSFIQKNIYPPPTNTYVKSLHGSQNSFSRSFSLEDGQSYRLYLHSISPFSQYLLLIVSRIVFTGPSVVTHDNTTYSIVNNKLIVYDCNKQWVVTFSLNEC